MKRINGINGINGINRILSESYDNENDIGLRKAVLQLLKIHPKNEIVESFNSGDGFKKEEKRYSPFENLFRSIINEN